MEREKEKKEKRRKRLPVFLWRCLILCVFSPSPIFYARCFHCRRLASYIVYIERLFGELFHHAQHIEMHRLHRTDLHHARSTGSQRSNRRAERQLQFNPVHLPFPFPGLWRYLCQSLLPARHHHPRAKQRRFPQCRKLPDWLCLQGQRQ